MEKDLPKSGRILEIISKAAKINVWKYDTASRKITFLYEMESASTSRSKMGIPDDVVTPDSFLCMVAKEDREKYLDLFRKIEEGAGTVEADIHCCTARDTMEFYLHIMMFRFYDKEEVSSVIYGFTQDVTLRKWSELKYHNVSRQIMQIYPSATAAVQLNLTQNWCGVPQGQNANLFYTEQGSADEFFQKLKERIADPDLREHLRDRLSREWLLSAFYHGRSEFSFEYPLLLPDGSRIWCNGRALLMQNPLTGDIEAIASNLDINEQKRRAQIMEKVASDEFDFIGLLNPQKNTFEFFYRKSGSIYSRMEILDDYDKDRKIMRSAVVSPKDFEQWWKDTSVRKVCRQLAKDGRYSLTYEGIEEGGVTRRLMRYYWLDQPEGDILVMHSDITTIYAQEQRQIQRTQRALAAAEQANHAKAEFVSRVSHDIRTPIGLVNQLAEFALRDVDDKPKLMDELEKIRSVGSLLLSLVNDVLDVAKIESGKLELRLEPCSYQDIMGDMLHIFETICEQKHQTFSLEEEGINELGRIFVDKVRLKQLLLNLVSNAVKYTPENGRITVRASVSDGKEGCRRVVFSVKDTGIGMSKAFQKKMFQPFAQEYENPYRQEGTASTGLGLSIVKKIAELMEGTLSVESTVGKGTEISFDFQAEAAEALERSGEISEIIKEIHFKKPVAGKALLAEDNEINAEVTQRILEMLGVESVWEQNGARALKRFADSKPNEFGVVLMDVQMPILNGYQAAEYIRLLRRTDARTVPIIAMTADAFDEAMERAQKSGMDAYLTKPIEPEKLKSVLQSCLGTGEIAKE